MRKLIYILLIISLTSCSFDLNLETGDVKEKLVLYCFPLNFDTTAIQLSRSIPVGTNKGDTSVRSAKVNFTVNGEEQNIYWNEDSISSLPAQCYYALGKLKKNDVIQIRANIEGLTPINAQTSIPDEFPLKAINLIPVEESGDNLQIQITFQDNAATKDYYGIRIMKQEVTIMDDEVDSSLESIELDLKDEPLLNKITDLDEIFMLSNGYVNNLYIWNDEKIQGQEYTLHLTTGYQEDFNSEWTGSAYKAEYKVYLYSFSHDLFKYLDTLNKTNSNNLGNHGFSPVLYQFSNVVGGIGVLGGCQIKETEWLKNP